MDDVMGWMGDWWREGKSRPCWMGRGYDVISASDFVHHLSNFFDEYFYFIWHKKKGKIAGPARVSGRASRAFLNRFRVLSRGGDGGNRRGGGGVDEGFFHRFMWKKKKSHAC